MADLCAVVFVLVGYLGFPRQTGSGPDGANTMQVLFTLGLLPLVFLALLQLHWKLEVDQRGMACGVLNGVFTGLGLLAYYAALARGKASIVGPVTSLFPLLTVALAFLLLKERLNRVQILGVVCALTSIFIFSR
ncbi:MAG: EamA family transporter [Acidobacteria bacterium]|nr:EamA family transporter [Acidobacteriota bacterium]